MFVEEQPDVRLGEGAHKFVDRGTIAEQLDRRDAADAELSRDRLLLLGVDLAENELTSVLVDQLGQDGHQYLAGLTPAGPEVQQHGYVVRPLQDDLFVIGLVDLEDKRRICHRPGAPELLQSAQDAAAGDEIQPLAALEVPAARPYFRIRVGISLGAEE